MLLGDDIMKGYYKNWYQHYKEVDEQREREIKRGYFTDIPENDYEYGRLKSSAQKPNLRDFENSYAPKRRSVRKKRSFFGSFFGLLLPLSTILGFGFLWYQLDMGPVRTMVNDALVFVGVREDVEVVLGYHMELLERHEAFVEKVEGLNFSEELNLAELHGLYQEIKQTHAHVNSLPYDGFTEANRLWGFNLQSVSNMMYALDGDLEHIDEVFGNFILDQTEIANMVREALGIGF